MNGGIHYKYDFEFYENENQLSETYLFLRNLANSSPYQKALFKCAYKKFEKLKLLGIRNDMEDFDAMYNCEYDLWQMRVPHPEGSFRVMLSKHPKKENHFLILNCYNIRSFRTPLYEVDKAIQMYESFIQDTHEDGGELIEI